MFLETIEEQAEQGVDYFTIHAGVLLRLRAADRRTRHRHRLARRLDHGEVVPAPPRGELPLHGLPRDLRAARRSTTCRSRSATACGPGSIADANDAAQFGELEALGELTKIAWEPTTCRR
jgi:phosphomethylpyrimidine synthase